MKRVDVAVAEIAARHYGVLVREDLLQAGMTPEQIRGRVSAGYLLSLHRGVYRLAACPRSWEQELLAACRIAGPRAAVSHRAAASLWRMRGFVGKPVEITAPDRHRPVPGACSHIAPIAPIDISWRGPFRVTTPERTLVDLAGVTRIAQVESALDDGLLRGMVDFTRLVEVYRRVGGRGRRGSKAMGDLLGTRGPETAPTESELELAILNVIRRSTLPEPIRQYPVEAAAGRMRLDFAYPDQRLAIEGDSVRWHCARADLERNAIRRNRLLHLGWRVLAFTWADATERPDYVVGAVRRELDHTRPGRRDHVPA